MALLPGFMKGQSDNLPKIDSLSMFSFLGHNPDFMGAEIRGIKAQRSGRESYGDNAIGYVQVKRDKDTCTVCAKVTPEHSVRKKAYSVELQCNETEENIISVQCNDCAASLGGCKHAIALVMWLHRRSEEPSVTSVASYWKKSKLSSVGTTVKFIKGKDLVQRNFEPLTPLNGSFLHKVIQKSQLFERNDTVLTKYYKKKDEFSDLSLYDIFLDFVGNKVGTTADEFLAYSASQMTELLCIEATNKTIQQSESNLWHQLRYGRITASKAHEAAHCHITDGSLVETILGATAVRDTKAMARGRKLEQVVRKKIEKKKNIKIQLCGFATSEDYPIMGASPDGISDNYTIEIKCPSSQKAMKTYIKDGKVTDKFKAQLQLQMLFFKKRQGLFCVASHNFEISGEVEIIEVDFDEHFCKDLVENCTSFWKNAIFPFVMKNFT